MDELFTSFLSKDYLTYEYTENLCCKVADEDLPGLEYNETFWENIFKERRAYRKEFDESYSRLGREKESAVIRLW